jgi:hypothetical protein
MSDVLCKICGQSQRRSSSYSPIENAEQFQSQVYTFDDSRPKASEVEEGVWPQRQRQPVLQERRECFCFLSPLSNDGAVHRTVQ